MIPSLSTSAAASAATFKIVGQFNVPLNCCASFLYANNEIFGTGNITAGRANFVDIFSASTNQKVASIPMASPLYQLFDSVDKTVFVLGQYGCASRFGCFDLVSISPASNKVIENTTVSSSIYFNFVAMTFDAHDDSIYAASPLCGLDGCHLYVINAKTDSLTKTISMPLDGFKGCGCVSIWSVVFDSRNNHIFVSASDGPNDLCTCFGAIWTVSDNTNKIISTLSGGTGGVPFLYPYFLDLDISNNLIYAFDWGSNSIDVVNANTGKYVTTIDPQSDTANYGLMPASYALDENLVSGMMYAGGCYANGGIINAGGCYPYQTFQYWANGTYYSIAGTKITGTVGALSSAPNTNCLNAFWSTTTKLTYVECGSKLVLFNSATGSVAGTVKVQGTVVVFNRLNGLLYVLSGNTIYEIGT